jgi:hypothetical protein
MASLLGSYRRDRKPTEEELDEALAKQKATRDADREIMTRYGFVKEAPREEEHRR